MDGFTTRAIRASTRAPRVDQRPTSVPIYQTVAFSAEDADELAAVTLPEVPGYAYSRLDNPTVDALGSTIAELEDLLDLRADFAHGPAAARAAVTVPA